MKKYIVFDLDGTLTPQRTSSVADFEKSLLPGAREFFDKYPRELGYCYGVASNQSMRRNIRNIADHMAWVRRETGMSFPLWLMHWETKKEFQKPHPRLLERFYMESYCPDKRFMLFVGDQETDKQAADAFGCDFAWANEFFENPDKFMLGVEE